MPLLMRSSDQLALELRRAGDDRRHHPTRCRRQVEGEPVQRDHRYPPSLQVLQRVQEIDRAAAPA
jgi:hypothetical protein